MASSFIRHWWWNPQHGCDSFICSIFCILFFSPVLRSFGLPSYTTLLKWDIASVSWTIIRINIKRNLLCILGNFNQSFKRNTICLSLVSGQKGKQSSSFSWKTLRNCHIEILLLAVETKVFLIIYEMLLLLKFLYYWSTLSLFNNLFNSLISRNILKIKWPSKAILQIGEGSA